MKDLEECSKKSLGSKLRDGVINDEEGVVYGYPSQVAVDVGVHNEKILLVEITSYARVSDVYG